MFTRNTRKYLSFFFSMFLVAAAGCGGDNSVEVRGTVNFDGKPVTNGVVLFEPVDRLGPTRAVTITDGSFELTGKEKVPPGEKIVRIRAMKPTGKKIPVSPGSSQLVDEVTQYIPVQYNDRSTLKTVIEPDKTNELTYDLKRS